MNAALDELKARLESLATKEFVRKEINDAVMIIDAKFDKLTKDIGDQFQNLSEKVEHERRWRMRVTGVASILALLFVAISSLLTTLVNLGVIKP